MREEIVQFIRMVRGDMGAKGGVVGLSGGVDSSVCMALFCEAMGPENCLGVIIPAWDSNPKDEDDAQEIAKCLGIRVVVHPMIFHDFPFPKHDFEKEVKPLLLSMDNLIPPEIELPYIMKLRGRMHIITYYAKLNNYLQCQTLEKTEWMLGWFDKFGDGAGDIAPIRHLYKTQVYELAHQYISEGMLPTLVVERRAGSGNYPLTDFEELGGISFEDADDILDRLEVERMTNRKAYLDSFSPKSVNKIKRLMQISEPKRRIPWVLGE